MLVNVYEATSLFQFAAYFNGQRVFSIKCYDKKQQYDGEISTKN